jgi:hypothetical protein
VTPQPPPSHDWLDRLRALRDPAGTLLSVIVTVPPDPTALRTFPAQLDRVLATARLPGVSNGTGQRARAAMGHIRQAGAGRARDWFGRTIALVASAEGLLEEVRLPCPVPDRAVFGRRPYLRLPLQAAQRCRPHLVVVLDRRSSWLFEISAETVQQVRQIDDEGARAHAYGGWYGLDEYRARHHADELVKRHYAATVAAVGRRAPADRVPLVLGGHRDGVAEFLASLPPAMRSRVAGTFVIDPHTMTPDQVRTRAAAVLAEREVERQQQLALGLAEWEATGLAVQGVAASADAVGSSLAELLVVRGEAMVAGWACTRCSGLAATSGECRRCSAPSRPVVDLVDEMVATTLDQGGKVDLGTAEHVTAGVAVRLRHRVSEPPAPESQPQEAGEPSTVGR